MRTEAGQRVPLIIKGAPGVKPEEFAPDRAPGKVADIRAEGLASTCGGASVERSLGRRQLCLAARGLVGVRDVAGVSVSGWSGPRTLGLSRECTDVCDCVGDQGNLRPSERTSRPEAWLRT